MALDLKKVMGKKVTPSAVDPVMKFAAEPIAESSVTEEERLDFAKPWSRQEKRLKSNVEASTKASTSKRSSMAEAKIQEILEKLLSHPLVATYSKIIEEEAFKFYKKRLAPLIQKENKRHRPIIRIPLPRFFTHYRN